MEDNALLNERINIRGEIEAIRATLREREKSTENRFQAQEKAVGAALTAAKEAVDKAEKAQERRLDLLNEFRSQTSDEQARFVTKDTFEPVVDRLAKLESSIARAQVGGGLIAVGIITVIIKLFFP